ncbi:Oidioi.mRNA.OKI2018_I69.PAR.g12921.t1.cds [Oikopleura dioica]|uniref:Oidioi.mRNA.OKI2018_I69.PAR.g12921.t1.cds n=1 Tax=Oikopleura dioica TaxID=34765 RepID=A0ABN7S977_OIKDI|nr:Oidioi.mRNA.OKI2018_I69.PAR.g12921.t1.cds [Oikopleura dioica]
MKILQIPVFIFFASAFAQDDVGEDQAPEPEGEPEPQFECFSCELDDGTCGGNQTDASPTVTCPPGFSCSTVLISSDGEEKYKRGCTRTCEEYCVGHYDPASEGGEVPELDFFACTSCCQGDKCNRNLITYSSAFTLSSSLIASLTAILMLLI